MYGISFLFNANWIIYLFYKLPKINYDPIFTVSFISFIYTTDLILLLLGFYSIFNTITLSNSIRSAVSEIRAYPMKSIFNNNV